MKNEEKRGVGMKYEWLDAYCLAKMGTQKDYKAEWEATRYMVAGKMFAMQGGDKAGQAIVTLKLEPPYGLFLRETYKDIIPGYYMNKEHWNSLYLDGNVPDDVVREMVDMSHRLIVSALPKKQRQAIEAAAGNEA